MFHFKGGKQPRIVEKKGKNEKHETAGHNGNGQLNQNMFFFVVADFMSQDGNQFISGVFFDQGVKKHNPSEFPKTSKKGV